MPNLVFRFPSGRYHATPWGNHVNEGLVEWPPSPWRIARALLATGFTKLGWVEAPASARELMDALASSLPRYHLPPAVGAHTRHFMPTDSKRPEDRVKVFDAFAWVGKDARLGVAWPVSLSPAATSLLRELVPKLSYLGRAESVVEAELVRDAELPDGSLACPTDTNRPGVEPISLLAPQTNEDYARWLAAARPTHDGAGKKPRKSKPGPFPADAFAALLVDTAFLQTHGWTQPPGSVRAIYYRPPLSTSPVSRIVRTTAAAAADTALLALASDTSNREVLPRMTRALPQMELLHRALLSRVGVASCPELTGRDERRVPLVGHRHAVLMPLDLDADGQLDHVMVHAPMGLGAEAQRALRALRSTFTKGGKPLFVTLIGIGHLTDFRRVGPHLVAEIAESRVWTSRTPLVPPRHLKAKRHTIADQIRAELASRRLPLAERIELYDPGELVRLGFHHFVRARRDAGKAPATTRFFGLRIEFERPVAGPISLGYGSHFGLGLFAAKT